MLLEAPDGRLLEWESPEWMAQQFDPSISDPLSVCAPYLSREPQWLVLGGLGDSPDAQEALERWPKVRVLGIDVDPRALDWQRNHGWRRDQDPLLSFALSDHIGEEMCYLDTLCCASLHPSNTGGHCASELTEVAAITLDALDQTLGPFEDCILWLDLEGYDYKALLGAEKLLTSGRVLLIGVEARYDLEEETNPIMRQLLRDSGYEHCLTWFRQWWGHNELWRRKS